MGTTERLQRNAEQKRREEGLREQLTGLLNTVGGIEESRRRRTTSSWPI